MVFAGLALLLAAGACKGDGQDGSGGTEPGTTGTTADDPPTEATPTGTEADTSTGLTTGGSTGSPLVEQCLMNFANGAQIVEAQCQCAVDQGQFPDVETCVAMGASEATPACVCEVYSGYPETLAGLECAAPAQAGLLACLEGVSCAQGTDAFDMCRQVYVGMLSQCEPPPKAAGAEVLIACEGYPPFMCGSGETVPELWRCDSKEDCADESDESTCEGALECADGDGWYPGAAKCDGLQDCADGSDEVNCPTFMCENGNTIPEAGKCDGYPSCCMGMPDCRDLSDEAGCPTFMCMSGETIPLAFQCDGFPDCMDMSDETDCPTFMCGSGESVPAAKKCDGVPDCEDLSDESDCGK